MMTLSIVDFRLQRFRVRHMYSHYVIVCRNVGAASAAMRKPAVSLADSTDLRYSLPHFF